MTRQVPGTFQRFSRTESTWYFLYWSVARTLTRFTNFDGIDYGSLDRHAE